MKAEFQEYLLDIGVNGVFMERTKLVYSFFDNIYKDGIVDIFVSDYLNEDGNKVYDNMWIFTDQNIHEAKDFLTTFKYDAAVYKNKIKYWEVSASNYSFNNITNPDSRFSLDVSLFDNITCKLKSSSNNCKYLNLIFNKYFRTLSQTTL